MTHSNQISPRSEAINSIIEVRGKAEGATIMPQSWDKIVGIAWENRTLVGDRRDVQRELRQVLLESTRDGQ
jgi:hypothetical protein